MVLTLLRERFNLKDRVEKRELAFSHRKRTAALASRPHH